MFSGFNNIDKKTLYIILGVIALVSAVGMGVEGILSLLCTLPGVILAVTFHEFAHAYTADRLGDLTPRSQGRVSLDPTKHLDPFGFILMMFTHIGWGKPVQISPVNFTRNVSMKKGEMLVALAGPVTNFILAIIFAIIKWVMILFYVNNGAYETILNIVMYAEIVNVGLCVFNLVPIPPLDGSKIFKGILPYKYSEWLERNESNLSMIFMVLWITGLLGKLVSPVIELVYSAINLGIARILGLFF